DCDDADAANVPGGVEVCDGQDNDCDVSTIFAGEASDVDTDGSISCLDCDDGDASNFPGNTEACDGADNDCDALTFADVAGEVDIDSDGVLSCLDCDDTDPLNYPGNAEVCDGQDNDCDPATVPAGGDDDVDGDGDPSCTDCDDGDAANFTGNAEICDGQDNDCDAQANFGLANDWTMEDSLTGAVAFAPLSMAGATPLSLTDDETSAAIPLGFSFDFAGATYTDVFVRSNGWVDFVGQSPQSIYVAYPIGQDDALNDFIAFWWADLDPSAGGTVGYRSLGAPGVGVFVLEFAGISYFNPDAAGSPTTQQVTVQLHLIEAGNLIEVHVVQGDAQPANISALDNSRLTVGVECGPPNADVYIDQDPTASLTNTAIRWSPAEEVDTDGDGVSFCAGDCAEQEASVAPGAVETCDGFDTDCDPSTTVAGDLIDGDRDGDPQCSDCDDADVFNANGYTEVCDGQDNDCVGGADFDVAGEVDIDGDASISCFDCDDADAANYPGNSEICDAQDNDCDAATSATDENTDVDTDGDPLCSDCDDGDGANFNGNSELCDGQDNDCVGGADFDLAGEVDGDGDASLSCADCDDADPNNTPGGTEVCDGSDNDCDVTTSFSGENTDVDTDGEPLCSDCDDGDPLAFPGNPEQCSDSDSDCNGVVDDYLTASYSSSPGSALGPNAGTITVDTIVVTDPGVVSDLNVAVDITHTWAGDLTFTLTSPAGTSAQVHNSIQLGSGANFTDTVWDDEGANAVITTADSAPYTGSFQPASPLDVFDGETIAGTWTMTISDDNNQDGGTWNSWSLDLFPDGYGDQAECGALSCSELIDLDPSAIDDDYFLDPTLSGNASLYSCDMTTSNGGWTKVFDFDRENDGDGIAEFEAEFSTSFTESMGIYTELSDSIRWQDGNGSEDTLDGVDAVVVPNGGEVLYDLRFQGTSMENSGIFFGAGTASTEEQLWCSDNAFNSYTAAELAGKPYTCSLSFVASPNYQPGPTQVTMSSEVTSVFIYALMADANGGDDARLFRHEVWVR
ncbi:MAG: proprotein convertase P-domain-containing protein, partial [Deltaproteobacteria bacterium]|nr:proprotein convertase P-domain-containing protein [Deltaproteobacteria bacterium]